MATTEVGVDSGGGEARLNLLDVALVKRLWRAKE